MIRSNYYYPESTALYDLSVQLYESLSRERNYNIMFSQRGMLVTAHFELEMEMATRNVNAKRLNGADAKLPDLGQVKKLAPILNFNPDAPFPIHGAVWQGRAGTARDNAVVWGYACAADALGVDIFQNCEVTDIITEAGRCIGVATTQGKSVAVQSARRLPGILRFSQSRRDTRFQSRHSRFMRLCLNR